jgi:hypothetical protein
VGYEPLESYVDIVLLLAGDGIAADLPVLQNELIISTLSRGIIIT